MLQLREFAGQSQDLGAGGAEGTAAGTHDDAVMPLPPQRHDHLQLCGIVGSLAFFDGGHVGVVPDLDDGLQHQDLFVSKQTGLHLLRAAAVRGTGVIGTILPAEIFRAVRPKGKVEYELGCIHDGGVGEAFVDGALDHFRFCHKITPKYRKILPMARQDLLWHPREDSNLRPIA